MMKRPENREVGSVKLSWFLVSTLFVLALIGAQVFRLSPAMAGCDQVQCADNQHQDIETCDCVCNTVLQCNQNQFFNTDSCACKCDTECNFNEILNPDTCECEPDNDCDGIPDSMDKCDISHCPLVGKAAPENVDQAPPVEQCNTDNDCNVIKDVVVKDGSFSADLNAPVKMVCQNCQCVSACSLLNCDDHNDCTTDSCDDNTGQCINTQIDNCPAPSQPTPPPEDPPIQQQSACVGSLVSQGFSVDEAHQLESQGICGGSLEGQTARACSLVVGGSAGSPWTMLLPLLTGAGWMSWMRNSRKKK
jgi:hypothetical protein